MEFDTLHRKMDKLKDKARGLEAWVDELKDKVSRAKDVGVAEFKESDAYRLELNTVIVQFLCKKRVNIWSHH